MERKLLSFLALTFIANTLLAKDYKDCTNHYFKNNNVAASECWDAGHRFGMAKVFNNKGYIVYEKEIRSVGGHSAVQFTYYDNGAVKTASWRSAPDGGIQWYSSVTTFSQEGKVTGETTNNYDDGPAKGIVKARPNVKAKQDTTESAIEAIIYASEFWFINSTPYVVIVDATRNKEKVTTTLKPGEILKGGELILAQHFEDPTKYYHFSVRPANPKEKKKLVVMPSEKKPRKTGKEKKRYYFEVRRML